MTDTNNITNKTHKCVLFIKTPLLDLIELQHGQINTRTTIRDLGHYPKQNCDITKTEYGGENG